MAEQFAWDSYRDHNLLRRAGAGWLVLGHGDAEHVEAGAACGEIDDCVARLRVHCAPD